MGLFQLGNFTSAAGLKLTWKIECDALTDDDWQCIAAVVGPGLDFGEVEGVPNGGVKLAHYLKPYATGQGLLIAEDVLTTGNSMNRHRAGRPADGLVLFSRAILVPPWVRPILQLSHWLVAS